MRTIYTRRIQYEEQLMEIPPTDREISGDIEKAEQDNLDSDYLLSLRERLEDAIGESSHCSDGDCACHAVPARIREEIEWHEEH